MGALGSYASSRTTDRNAKKTSAFPVGLENAVRGQNPERSDIWKMCPTVGATESLESLCPPLMFPESSAVFMYLHGTNTTPQILAPRYSDSFSPSHTNTAPVQSKWETPFIKLHRVWAELLMVNAACVPRRAEGLWGRRRLTLIKTNRKLWAPAPCLEKEGSKTRGSRALLNAVRLLCPIFPLPPSTG